MSLVTPAAGENRLIAVK